jgi:hypothetical protein
LREAGGSVVVVNPTKTEITSNSRMRMTDNGCQNRWPDSADQSLVG